jgi:hypothetical protein
MSEYKRPIRVDINDPICTASVLGNTVIGVIFVKVGDEIKKAIKCRLETIDSKIEQYKDNIKKIEPFIEEKRIILKEMEEYNQNRDDERKILAKTYDMTLEKIRKEYLNKANDIFENKKRKINDFDEITDKETKERAVKFEESFDGIKSNISKLDQFIKKENRNAMNRGYTEMHSVARSKEFICDINNSTGIGTSNPSVPLEVKSSYEVKRGDKSIVRLNNLRHLLKEYSNKVNTIKERITELTRERRRLLLISDNILEDREYKLDLNKLSAFGFEDIER